MVWVVILVSCNITSTTDQSIYYNLLCSTHCTIQWLGFLDLCNFAIAIQYDINKHAFFFDMHTWYFHTLNFCLAMNCITCNCYSILAMHRNPFPCLNSWLLFSAQFKTWICITCTWPPHGYVWNDIKSFTNRILISTIMGIVARHAILI